MTQEAEEGPPRSR